MPTIDVRFKSATVKSAIVKSATVVWAANSVILALRTKDLAAL